MELIKKQIHMNQWKGNVTTQITLDDDFIVPDTLDDMEQVMLDTGEIQIETVKNQGDKVAVKGKLEFQVLYRKESGGLQTLGGNIPFEEVVNVQGLEEKDYVGLNWMLEDLNTDMINSRKLGVQAIITLQVRVETLRDVEAAVDVDMENNSRPAGAGMSDTDGAGQVQVETLKRTANAAAIAVRRKDTYRIKEELSLTGGKPNIGQLLWREMKLRDVTAKPLDGRLHLDGELSVFVIYGAEDENMPVQWLEETIPFSGDMEMGDVKEDQIPMVTVRLAHKDMEAKPDYDGEMREMDVDAVLELIELLRRAGQLAQAVELSQILIDATDDDTYYTLQEELLAELAARPRSLAVGTDQSLVIQNGQVLSRGSNTLGQLGTDPAAVTASEQYASAQYAGGTPVKVTCVGRTSFVVDADGALWAAGENRWGQMGEGYAITAPQGGWVQVPTPGAVADVAGTTGRLLVLLTDIDGLYTANPADHPDATLIERVEGFDPALYDIAGGSGSKVGTGGMVTKLHAVEIAFEKQIPVALCNGADPAILYDVLSGDFTGTLFVPAEKEAE